MELYTIQVICQLNNETSCKKIVWGQTSPIRPYFYTEEIYLQLLDLHSQLPRWPKLPNVLEVLLNYYLLFLAVLGPAAESRVCSLSCLGFSCWEHRLQVTWASIVAAWGLSGCSSRDPEHRLSSCHEWAQLLHGTWDLPGSGIEPTSPALRDGFFTIEPPGKPLDILKASNTASACTKVRHVCRIFSFFSFLRSLHHTKALSLIIRKFTSHDFKTLMSWRKFQAKQQSF